MLGAIQAALEASEHESDGSESESEDGSAASEGQQPAAGVVSEEGTGLLLEELGRPRRLGEANFDPQLWQELMCRALPAALDGSAPDQVIIAYALGCGWEGAEPDWVEAVKWYSYAAEDDNSDAIFVLGVCHAKGRGVRQDWDRAHGYFLSAAELGDLNGMFQTAWCYMNGKGTGDQDLAQAEYWCQQAVERGHAKSETMLAAIQKAIAAEAAETRCAAAAAAQRSPIRMLSALMKRVAGRDNTPRRLGEADFDPQVWEDSLCEVLPRAIAGSPEDQALVRSRGGAPAVLRPKDQSQHADPKAWFGPIAAC